MNKYFIYDLRFNQAQKEYLKTLGFTNFYGCRDREGTKSSIEPRVLVNHIADFATNFEIKFDEENLIMFDDFMKQYNPKEVGLSDEEYKELEARR